MSLRTSLDSPPATNSQVADLHEVEASSTLVLPPAQESLNELMERALKIKDEPVLELKAREFVPKTAVELFHSDALLIRGMSDEEVFEDIPFTDRPKLGAFRKEMEYMKDTGLVNTSSTLGVPGKGVGMYKPLAFLFNGESSELQHIYGIDSNSCTTETGELIAGMNPELTYDTLGDLATAVRTTNLLSKATINEVNGKFKTKDLVGLAARSITKNPIGDAALNLKIRSIQKLIQQKYGIKLPIYKYDETTGRLTQLDESTMTIRDELNTIRLDPVNRNYRAQIQEFLLGD
ncbi:hypothetical protein [Simkania sp.]|uniref:hypothetical protein n=1 Tax=Simkania sp. TaxID=34094 RepID=UPI003B530215